MKEIIFYGQSDDLIEIEGFETPTELYGERAEVAVEAGGLRMGVRVNYNNFGTWDVTPILLDENDVWPDWEVRIGRRESRRGRPSYTLQLSLIVPDDAKLVVMGDNQKAL